MRGPTLYEEPGFMVVCGDGYLVHREMWEENHTKWNNPCSQNYQGTREKNLQGGQGCYLAV